VGRPCGNACASQNLRRGLRSTGETAGGGGGGEMKASGLVVHGEATPVDRVVRPSRAVPRSTRESLARRHPRPVIRDARV